MNLFSRVPATNSNYSRPGSALTTLPRLGLLGAFVGAFFLSAAATANDAKNAPKGTDADTPACEAVVLNFEPKGLHKDELHVAEILTNTFAAEVASTSGCKIITQSDIRSMTEFDAQRQLCGSEESCMAEIGSALGVDIIIGGAVGRLGDAYTLQIMKRNVSKGVVEARIDETITGGAAALQDAARNAARKLYGVGEDNKASRGATSSKAATSSRGAASKTGETTTDDVEDAGGGGTGTMLLFTGIGLASAGALVLGAGSAFAFGVDLLILGDKTIDGETKDGATTLGILALVGGVGLGAVALVAGASLAGVGAISE